MMWICCDFFLSRGDQADHEQSILESSMELGFLWCEYEVPGPEDAHVDALRDLKRRNACLNISGEIIDPVV